MAKIVVYDVAAEYGGAFFVLQAYFQKALEDQENEYFFVVSKVELKSCRNIHIIKLQWVKKSWLHRLYCDYVYMPRLIERIDPIRVLSLQNMGIRYCNVLQTVYVHNAIPFTEYQFQFLSDPYLWIYQNIIGRMICDSLKDVDEIIVQNEWMRDAVVRECGISNDSIMIDPVKVNVDEEKTRIRTKLTVFFYPAKAFSFKNHQIIIEACKRLNLEKKYSYKVAFTLTGKGKIEHRLYKEVQKYKLPIEFVGFLDKKEVNGYYRKSILLFPSYIETVGLPLLEAMEYDAPIIVSDCLYSRSILENYDNVYFFEKDDCMNLAECMRQAVLRY
ncbi:MAG: glycosyltransferase family 4 protein [Ruminococcus sp.]|nr:glycosyltransferase family 4 protein [Ruminococcus sp.]